MRLSPEQILQNVVVENIEAMAREFRAGKPVVLVLSHLATWELFAPLMPKFVGFVRNSSVYQKLGNRFIDAHVRASRSRTGLELFDRREGFQPVIDLLRSGGGVGILRDQHAGDQGIWTPFFGKLASTSPLPALLAKRSRAGLIAAAVYTTGTARWRMVFTERFDIPGASIEALTSKINEIIEQKIRYAPEDGFWVHNRWKTPRPNFLLPCYKRGVFVPKNISLQSFRILIRSSNWLGDAVMSVPAVRAIKKGRPDAHVTILAPEKIAPMWKLIPEVDEVLALPNKSLFTALRVIAKQKPFDVAILFPNSLRVALEAWRIPRKVGYRGHNRSCLLNQIVREPRKPGPPAHHAIRFLRIAEGCGAGGALAHTCGDVSLPQTSSIKDRTSLVLCPGAEYGPAKRWLPERFAEVATAVSEKTKQKWILVGTDKDKSIGETIATALGDNCTNRIGQTTMEELILELRSCRALLTNDTGTMHLAALLGLPVVAVFGSTEPALTGPMANGH